MRLYVAVASCKKSEKVHVSEKTNISYTLIGIHKENIAYVLNEWPLKNYDQWNYFFKGMLRLNIEHFLEKLIWEKFGISEMK